jgi:hypothetical protein
VKVGTTKLLGGDLLAGGGLDQRLRQSAQRKGGIYIHRCEQTTSSLTGPARKIVPCSLTMMLSSAMAGTYAPPAVHEPITTAICDGG